MNFVTPPPQDSDNGLYALRFKNSFLDELPADPLEENYCRQVKCACYTRVKPKPMEKPRMLAFSSETAQLIGLSEDQCLSQEFAEIFTGNALLPGMDPHAMCYGGHQFGNWAGQLGDGRAINLGDVINEKGERWALQLKGAGPTPYARGADGLAVLRSSIREFLCSEAMHHLGVPTTRALCVNLTGEEVLRDMFYNGNSLMEPGAVVCRVAPSFLRFGSFQILTAQQDIDLLRRLVDFTLKHFYPELGPPGKESYLAWFRVICQRTAKMIADWMRVGFVHGVMNTDNMSILGLTIDYGPYGWLEDYDPDWTPNTTDAGGRRYRYSHQPQIAHWNLWQLANAIQPLFKNTQGLEEVLNEFPVFYQDHWSRMMASKLGFSEFRMEPDQMLWDELLVLFSEVETDMTMFFRLLSRISNTFSEDSDPLEILGKAFYRPDDIRPEQQEKFQQWIIKYQERLAEDGMDPEQRVESMNLANPKYVFRNYMAQIAIDQATEGDPSLIKEMLELLRRPYDEQPEQEKYFALRPEWARHRPGCSMLSCSS
ncbi:MAG: YdiU family protein [SAR324 cluster bacterium]|nr:YdiU family protein [SAR324 cluster bacterium]|tara:strand:- start:207 stop:1826 length:1620 start_codon:yes stop_codon:yes gene_type:complete